MTPKTGYHDLPLAIRQKIITYFIKDFITGAFDNGQRGYPCFENVSSSLCSSKSLRYWPLLTMAMQMQRNFTQACVKLDSFPYQDSSQPPQYFYAKIVNMCERMEVKSKSEVIVPWYQDVDQRIYSWPDYLLIGRFVRDRLQCKRRYVEAKMIAEASS